MGYLCYQDSVGQSSVFWVFQSGFVLASISTPAWDRSVHGHQSQSQTNGPFDYQMCLAVSVIIQSCQANSHKSSAHQRLVFI